MKEGSGEVAFTGVAEEEDDALASKGVFGSEATGDSGDGPRRDANKHPFVTSEIAGGLHRIVFSDGEDAIDDGRIIDFGDKAAAEALEDVGSGGTAGEDRGSGRFDSDDLDRGVLAFEEATDAGDQAASADASDEGIQAAFGLLPDLDGGGFFVDGGIGGVCKLRGHIRAGDLA